MAGIISYGAYIPIWRIERSMIAGMSLSGSMGGERSFAARDEDSISMAVEAGTDCLAGFDPKQIDGLYFAGVSSPYKLKQGASIIASALDMRKNIQTIDFNSCTRAQTSAVKVAVDTVKAGTARKILVIGSDHRVARPGSQHEQLFGDGAAALLIGDTGVIGEIDGFSSISNPIPGPWQRNKDEFLKTYDPKFDRINEILGDVPEAVNELLKQLGLKPADISRFALAGLDPRSYLDMARAIKFNPKEQMDDPLFSSVGNIGTPHCILLLIAAIEKAKTGERLVCASHGEGGEAFLVRITEENDSVKRRHRGTKYISSKKMIPSYGLFAEWQGTRKTGWPGGEMNASVVLYAREEKWGLPFYGMKCNQCGTIQYPISRTCVNCRAYDDAAEVKIVSTGKIFTYTHDYLMAHGTMPGDGLTPWTRAVLDMDDGCRLFLEVVDAESDEIKIGAPVERTFRRLHQKGGYCFYGWRARPLKIQLEDKK